MQLSMSNVTQQLKLLLEKEISTLDVQLQHYEKDNEEKLKQIAEVQNDLLTQLLENHTLAEKAIVYQKLIDKKEQDIKSYEESSRKKLALVDDLVKKHQNTMSIRSDLRDRSITTLKRMMIADEFHYGNMRIFRADIKAKRSKIALEITEARNELAEKKKQFETLNESLKQIYCAEISPFIKREISEDCQNILKEGRKRLLALKMENRALWMKLNHNV